MKDFGKTGCTICNNKFLLTETGDTIETIEDMNRLGCECDKCKSEVQDKCLKILADNIK